MLNQPQRSNCQRHYFSQTKSTSFSPNVWHILAWNQSESGLLWVLRKKYNLVAINFLTSCPSLWKASGNFLAPCGLLASIPSSWPLILFLSRFLHSPKCVNATLLLHTLLANWMDDWLTDSLIDRLINSLLITVCFTKLLTNSFRSSYWNFNWPVGHLRIKWINCNQSFFQIHVVKQVLIASKWSIN